MEYNTLCAFITATDVEIGAQFAFFDWKELRFDGEDQLFYETTIRSNNQEHRIVMAKQNEMGMVSASFLSSKLITLFRPKYLIMTGIAAGLRSSDAPTDFQEYGDVVVAEMVWNYSNGKYVDLHNAIIKFGNIGFSPRPLILEMDPEVKQDIVAAIESKDNPCYVRLGAMACGVSVVANAEYVNKYIRSQFNETAALDMESYAVMYASVNAPEPRPKAIVIKSVCDFADGRKDDKYQRFAAYTSTEFAKFLLENYLKA